MSNISLQQSDLSKIKWVQTNYMNVPGKCMNLLLDMKSSDPYILANKYNLIGIIQFFKCEHFEALKNYDKAIEISKEHKFYEIETKALINKSSIYISLKRYALGLEFGFESLKYKFERLNSMSYSNLSLIYEHLGDYEKQIEFQSKAKSLNDKTGEKRLVVQDLYNIAESYHKQGKLEKALETYEESLEVIVKYKFNTFLTYSYKKMAILCYEMEQFEQALHYSNKTEECSNKFEIDDRVGASYVKAKLFCHYKKYDEALKLLDNALIDLKTGNNYEDVYKLKIEIESKHRPETLVDTYKDYVNLLKSDTHNSKEKTDLTNILKFKEKEIEEIQQRNEAIEVQNRELEVVSKLLAHDLKTPIRTIGSFVNLIKNKLKVKSDPEINEYIEYISNGTLDIYQKMEVTEKYLNYKLFNQKTSFDLPSLLDQLVFRFQSNDHNVNITIDKGLPAIYGDRMAIQRMFEYLFRFIIKHSRNDQVKIHIAHETDGKEDLFLIKDEKNTMLFAKYWFEEIFRSEVFKTGKVDIGFAFVRKIVKLHKGHLLIDEQEDGNPLLKIWLPVNA